MNGTCTAKSYVLENIKIALETCSVPGILTGRCEQALEDLRSISSLPNFTPHGSQTHGLALVDSDLDVQVEGFPLLQIERLCRSSSDFTIENYILSAKIPRLILVHQKYDLHIDIIESQPNSTKLDQVFLEYVSYHPTIREYALMIKLFLKGHRDAMPVQRGYPGSSTFLIIGFFYLMNRPQGRLLWAINHRERFDRDLSAALSTVAMPSALSLYIEFLVFLRDDIIGQVTVSLREYVDLKLRRRNKSPCISQNWCVLHPYRNQNLTQFRYEQAIRIHHFACEELKAVRNYMSKNQ